MDVAGRKEFRQVIGIHQIAESDPARCGYGCKLFQCGPFAPGTGDHHRHLRRQQGGGGDEHAQPLLTSEVSGVHGHRRLRSHAPGCAEAVGAGPRTHTTIIDPVGEHADRMTSIGLGANLPTHRRRDGRHQIDIAEDQPLESQQQAGHRLRHHAEFDGSIDLEILHVVDHRDAPAQAQPEAEQSDEEGRSDEHDGVGSFACT